MRVQCVLYVIYMKKTEKKCVNVKRLGGDKDNNNSNSSEVDGNGRQSILFLYVMDKNICGETKVQAIHILCNLY